MISQREMSEFFIWEKFITSNILIGLNTKVILREMREKYDISTHAIDQHYENIDSLFQLF